MKPHHFEEAHGEQVCEGHSKRQLKLPKRTLGTGQLQCERGPATWVGPETRDKCLGSGPH